jgi:hypothetical protein
MKDRFTLLTVLVVIATCLVSARPVKAQEKKPFEPAGPVSVDSSAQGKGRDFAPQKRLLGIVKEDGGEITFVSRFGNRAWSVQNPETLRGLNGQQVQVIGHFHRESNSVRVIRVRTFQRAPEKAPLN